MPVDGDTSGHPKRYPRFSLAVRAPGIRKAHTVLRQAFQSAVKWREIAMNPALSVELPKVEREREMRIIEAARFGSS